MPCDRVFYIKKLLSKCDDDEKREIIQTLSHNYYIPVVIKKSELKMVSTYNTRLELDRQIKEIVNQIYHLD